jgi:hypothetical protein
MNKITQLINRLMNIESVFSQMTLDLNDEKIKHTLYLKHTVTNENLFFIEINETEDFLHSNNSNFHAIQCELLSVFEESTDENINALKGNATLIFVLKVDDKLIKDQNFFAQVSIIEEDPFLFKKHVLYYTNNQCKALQNHDELQNIDELNKYINNLENYENDEDSLYRLYHLLLTKIPFLTYQPSNEITSTFDLEEQIKESIRSLDDDVKELFDSLMREKYNLNESNKS